MVIFNSFLYVYQRVISYTFMNIPLFSVPLTSKSTHWPWKKSQFWVEHINLPSRADGHDPPGWGSAGAYKINIQMRTPSAANWPWRWLSWKIWPCPSNYILSWSLGKKNHAKMLKQWNMSHHGSPDDVDGAHVFVCVCFFAWNMYGLETPTTHV